MTIKVAINGYGRISQNILRALYESGKDSAIQIVAINDLSAKVLRSRTNMIQPMVFLRKKSHLMAIISL